ncbi:MAG: hypothetical protein AAGC67_14885 [Myxococcota bacterium]
MRHAKRRFVNGVLSAGLAAAILAGSAGLAGAQLPGGVIPGVAPDPGLALPNWDADELQGSTVQKRDIVKAYQQAIEQLEDGRCRDALSKFDYVLEFVDDDPNVYYAAATAARCARSFRSAMGLYESTIEFDPARWEAYRGLGISYLALGDLEGATDTLGELDLAKAECADACAPELESAYAALRKVLEKAEQILGRN